MLPVWHHQPGLAVRRNLELITFISPSLALVRGTYLSPLAFRGIHLLPGDDVGVHLLRDNCARMSLCVLKQLLVELCPRRGYKYLRFLRHHSFTLRPHAAPYSKSRSFMAPNRNAKMRRAELRLRLDL